MLSVDTALPDVEELHKLVEQGQEKGFLTYDEITKSLEDVDLGHCRGNLGERQDTHLVPLEEQALDLFEFL